MTKSAEFAEFFLHSPAQSASNYVQWAEWLQDQPKIDYGCVLDKYVIPLHPGDLMAIVARPGHGKCLGRGTKVLMFDGSLKSVEDIVFGDCLMGPDSTPRRVLGTSQGIGPIYRITQNRGAVSYRVNGKHILSLKRSKNEGPHSHGDILNISVDECLQKGPGFFSRYKGYKVAVEFPEKELPIEPYFLGIWLGDGASKNVKVTTTDPEVIEYLHQYADRLLLQVSQHEDDFSITRGHRGKDVSKGNLQAKLSSLELLGSKYIPNHYLINSEANRLELLAGLVDSDGHYREKDGCFDIVQKNRGLALQIKFLADTLGFRTCMDVKQATIKSIGYTCTVYRLRMYGDLDKVPCRIERKKATTRKAIVNHRHTGIKITPDGIDEFFGFELSGDGLFLLEDMTVTHNSSFMSYLAKRTATKIVERGEQNKCVIYVSWEQSVEEIEAFFQSGQTYNSTDLAWGRVPLDLVRERTIKRVHLPVWMIGYSIKDADKKKPLMTIEAVYESIRAMRYEYNYEPVMICLDYLQIVPIPGSRERTQQVTEATIQAKHLAMEIGVPIVAGVQASRETDRRGSQIPTMADAQWSSAIEQTADKQLALFRPSKIMDNGESIDIGGRSYMVDEYLLIIKLLKQRFDVGYGVWAVHFEPETLTVGDYKITDLA